MPSPGHHYSVGLEVSEKVTVSNGEIFGKPRGSSHSEQSEDRQASSLGTRLSCIEVCPSSAWQTPILQFAADQFRNTDDGHASLRAIARSRQITSGGFPTLAVTPFTCRNRLPVTRRAGRVGSIRILADPNQGVQILFGLTAWRNHSKKSSCFKFLGRRFWRKFV